MSALPRRLTAVSPDGQWPALLVLLFLVATAVRVAAAWWFRGQPLGGDEIEYDALARGLIETGHYARQPGFSPLLYSPESGAPTSFRPPGWPFVLAVFYRVFGLSPMPPRLALAAWNAAGCVVLVLLVRHLFGERRVALAAGLLWALWPASVWYPGTRSTTLSTESLAIPVLLVALLLLAHAREDGGRLALLAGALFGACALVRSNLSLLVPLAAGWLLAATRGPGRTRVGKAVLVMMGAAAVTFPWMLRNLDRLGSFTIATQREPLFLGNNAWARGSYDAEFFNDASSGQVRWLEGRHPGFQERSEVEKARIYVSEAVTCARQRPLRQAWLTWRKALLFASPLRETEGGDNSYDWVFVTVGGLCVLGGAWLLKANRLSAALMALPVLATLATCLIVFSMPRYRYPAEPMIAALACQATKGAAGRYGAPAIAGVVALLLAVNVGIALIVR